MTKRIDSSGREPFLHQQEEERFHNGEEKLPDVDARLSQQPGTSSGIGYKETWRVECLSKISVKRRSRKRGVKI